MTDSLSQDRRLFLKGATAAALTPLLAANLEAQEKPGDKIAAPPRIRSITVLSFNLLVGGTQIAPLEQTAKLIRESGADVVGIQEIGKSGPKLAELTGLKLFDQGGEDTGLLSRFPIIGHSANKWGAKLDVAGRGPLWLFNAHLPASPYQPYQLAGIPYGNAPFVETSTEAIAQALTARGANVGRMLMEIGMAMRAGGPILLTGDFNEPSHLDWTERAAKAKRCQIPVAWPTSRAIVDAGLSDVYRAVHPDETKQPGHTWTPRPSKREVHDRIDMIYARGLKPISAKIIGESLDHADIVITPFPSDHRAVVVQVEFLD